MGAASIEIIDKHDSLNRVRAATGVWLLTAVYYFFQYPLRSVLAVMMPELSSTFNISRNLKEPSYERLRTCSQRGIVESEVLCFSTPSGKKLAA